MFATSVMRSGSCGLTTTAMAFACVLGAQSHAQGDDGFQELIKQFEDLESIAFDASVDVRVFVEDSEDMPITGDGRVIEGSYLYRADGDYYRVDSLMDTSKYPEMDTVIAYDGDRFQMLLRSPSILTLRPEDTNAAVLALPNPPLEMVQFLTPLTEETMDTRMRLKDIRATASDTSLAADAEWEVVEDDGVVLERTILPGGTYHDGDTYVDVEYTHHVYALSDKRHKPVRIDRVDDNGSAITSARFSHYEPHESGEEILHWPRHVDVTSFDPIDGSRLVTISFVIDEINANPTDIDPEVFTIEWTEADTVWDDELQVFLQQ